MNSVHVTGADRLMQPRIEREDLRRALDEQRRCDVKRSGDPAATTMAFDRTPDTGDVYRRGSRVPNHLDTPLDSWKR